MTQLLTPEQRIKQLEAQLETSWQQSLVYKTMLDVLPVAARLNRKLCEQARYSDAVGVLASPVTGGGVGLAQIEKIILLARAEGKRDIATAAHYVVEVMEETDMRFTKEGKTLDTRESVLAEPIAAVCKMDNELMPMLTALALPSS